MESVCSICGSLDNTSPVFNLNYEIVGYLCESDKFSHRYCFTCNTIRKKMEFFNQDNNCFYCSDIYLGLKQRMDALIVILKSISAVPQDF